MTKNTKHLLGIEASHDLGKMSIKVLRLHSYGVAEDLLNSLLTVIDGTGDRKLLA